MILGLTGQELRDRLDSDHWSHELLASVVCSVYWGGRYCVDLRELDRLDDGGWDVAMALMEYRRTPGWSDAEFYSLACWCRIRHNLGSPAATGK